MSDTPFDAKAPVVDNRRRERVDLDAGYVWVWEMEAADLLFIVERSMRPVQGDRPQLQAGDGMLWRIVVSCYKGEEPGSVRVFDITDLPRIQKLRKAEWDLLTEAMERVNGLDAEEVPKLKDFTEAAPGTNRRSSKPSASTISTG